MHKVIGTLFQKNNREKFKQKFITKINKSSETKYRQLYNQSPIIYVTIDLDGRIIDCNRAFLQKFGYKKEELVGSACYNICADKSRKLGINSLKRWKDRLHSKNLELLFECKNGSTFVGLLDTMDIKDLYGNIIAGLGIIKDIQEIYDARKIIEKNNAKIRNHVKELEEIGKLKDEFISMISHELKTPLVPIIGYCEILKEAEQTENVTNEYHYAINEIHESAISLNKIISNILDLNKLELGRFQFDLQKVKVEDLISSVYHKYKPITDGKKTQLLMECQENIEIVSDESRIYQVLENLLQNATKFVPKGKGRIKINVINNDSSVTFCVKDNGNGISEEKKHHIFKKFYQIDTSVRRQHVGTGLGLAICKGIVETLGGKIWVESQQGVGSEFFFSIPKYFKEDNFQKTTQSNTIKNRNDREAKH